MTFFRYFSQSPGAGSLLREPALAALRTCIELPEKLSRNTGVAPAYGAAVLRSTGQVELYEPAVGKSAIGRLSEFGQRLTDDTLVIAIEPDAYEVGSCLRFIVASGLKRILLASLHPALESRGRFWSALQELNGVECHLFGADHFVSQYDRRFWTYASKRRSYVHLKISLTCDGAVILDEASPTRLSCPASKERTHRLRGKYDAVVLGATTVRKDNPEMTYRGAELYPQPRKIILSRTGQLPQTLKVYQQQDAPIILSSNSALNIAQEIARLGMTSALVEGGKSVFEFFLESRILDEVSLVWTKRVAGPQSKYLDLSIPEGSSTAIGDDIWESIRWPVMSGSQLR